MVVDDTFYMKLAIDEAWLYQGLTFPNPAVGCVVLDKNDSILSIQAHKEAGCMHAELHAVKCALSKLNPNLIFPKTPNEIYEFILKNHNNLLNNCTIYVTLEPCSHFGKTPPCAFLLSSIKPKKVVIGTKDENKIASGGIKILKQAKIEVSLGVLEKEAKLLIEPFLSWTKDNFIFFKLAMSLNGSINGDISSLNSKKLCHKLRSKISLLAIGGNTVRVDRPILDSRLVKGIAPNILIYSKKNNFDTTIPLFNIPNRRVHISTNIQDIRKHKFVMIEGGYSMLEETKNLSDWFLIFNSSNFQNFLNIQLNLNLIRIWGKYDDHDSYAWYKRIK